MTTPTNPMNNFSPFLPSTYNLPEEKDRWSEWLGSNLSDITDVVNQKKIGNYTPTENFNGETWQFDSTKIIRNGYQFILRVIQYPDTGVLVLPLPIIVNPQFTITHVWGSASRPCTETGAGDGDYFSYFSQGNSLISFTMDDLAVTITTTADLTDYSGYVVCEYIKNGI